MMPLKIQSGTRKMKVILFALTGFGNKVLDALLEIKCEIPFILTRKEKGEFPYYDEENIAKYAKEKGIKIYENFEWNDILVIINKIKPELILVSTFHKIIPEKIISSVPYCINLHPSLLPKYRGATPVEWAIHNHETETGITAHLLTKELDAGDILIQEKIKIEATDNNQGLRKKLATLSAQVAKELIEQIKDNSLNPIPQNEREVTCFPNYFKKVIK